MFTNRELEMQAAVRGRSAAVKRDIQCACDAAFLRLRDKERQLLRVVDLVSSRQQGDLWAASLLRQQQQQQQHNDGAPPPPVHAMSLSLNTEMLNRAIQQFATVQLDGVMTSSAGVTSSSLPDGLEEYGAEEHLVSHKPLPGNQSSVRVTRPPSLSMYSQYHPDRSQSSVSSLASSEDDKFELIDCVIPEKIFQSDPIDIDVSQSRWAQRPTQTMETPHWEEHHSEEMVDPEMDVKLTTKVPHPLEDCKEAWLLPTGGNTSTGSGNSDVVVSPLAPWQAVMAADSLYSPALAAAPAVPEGQRWLLREATHRPAGRLRSPVAGRVSDCTGRLERMALADGWRSEWLLGGGGGGDLGNIGSSSLSGGFAPVFEEEQVVVKAAPEGQDTVPDLLAPFKEMEKSTLWVAARG